MVYAWIKTWAGKDFRRRCSVRRVGADYLQSPHAGGLDVLMVPVFAARAAFRPEDRLERITQVRPWLWLGGPGKHCGIHCQPRNPTGGTLLPSSSHGRRVLFMVLCMILLMVLCMQHVVGCGRYSKLIHCPQLVHVKCGGFVCAPSTS